MLLIAVRDITSFGSFESTSYRGSGSGLMISSSIRVTVGTRVRVLMKVSVTRLKKRVTIRAAVVAANSERRH